MAAGNIKGITIEISGETTGLQKALKNVTSESIGLQKELTQVDKLLKFNPGNAELIRQQQQLLSQQIETTAKKLGTLKEAQAQVDAQFASGKINGEQYRAFNRELVNTESSLNGLQTKLAATGQAQQDLESKTRQLDTLFKATGTSVDKFSNELGVGLTNAIKNGTASSKQLDTAIEKIGKASLGASADVDKIKSALKTVDDGASLKAVEKDLGRVSKSMGEATREAKTLKSELKGVGQGVGTAGAAGGAAAGALVTGMQDYNQTLARLRTNAAMAGNDLGLVEEAFNQIVAVTGEADSAVETVSNLLATGFTDNQLEEMINQINGAAIKFSDTLKTEGIADGIQETFASGEAIGQFGELLERSGVDVENFNSKLQAAQKEGKGTEFVMKTMADLGFGEVTAKYKEMNPEVQKNAEANANLQKALAELAIVITPLVAAVTEVVTALATWAGENPALVNTLLILGGAITTIVGVFSMLAPIVSTIIGLAPILGTVIGAISWPVMAVVAAIAALIAAGIAVYKNWDEISKYAAVVWAATVEVISSILEAGKNAILGIWNTVTSALSALWSTLASLATDRFNLLKTGITTIFNAIKTFVVTLWNTLSSGVLSIVTTLVSKVTTFFTNLKNGVSKIFDAIKTLASTIWNNLSTAVVDIVNSLVSKATSFFNNLKDTVSTIFNSIKSTASTIWNNLSTAVVDIITTLVSKIKTGFETAKNTVKTVMDVTKNVIENAWNGAKTIVTNAVDGIKTVVSNVFNALKTTVSTAMTNVKSAIETGWNKAKSFLEGISLSQIGKDIVSGLVSGIGSMFGNVRSKIEELAGLIPDWAKDVLGINSPSRVMADQVGKWIPEGIAEGMLGNQKSIHDAMGKLSDAAVFDAQALLSIGTSGNSLQQAMAGLHGSLSSSAQQMMHTGNVSNNNARTYDHSKTIQQTFHITAMDNTDIARQVERVNRRLAFEFRG